MEFNLEGKPFIELNKLLKFLGWCESGAKASQAISEELVKLNGATETRKRCKLRTGDKITFDGNQVTVLA
tara:strand:+ start:1522 stop:1731 length:210 start_codon:yes stop_codon:yes gene_type:complete